MLAQTAEEDERAGHSAVACPEGIPFIAFEGCRERLGAPTLSFFHNSVGSLPFCSWWKTCSALGLNGPKCPIERFLNLPFKDMWGQLCSALRQCLFSWDLSDSNQVVAAMQNLKAVFSTSGTCIEDQATI